MCGLEQKSPGQKYQFSSTFPLMHWRGAVWGLESLDLYFCNILSKDSMANRDELIPQHHLSKPYIPFVVLALKVTFFLICYVYTEKYLIPLESS